MENVPGPAAGLAQQAQPNFQSISNDHAQIAEVHQRLSNELLVFNNLHAADQGNHISQELAALRCTMETRFVRLNRQLVETNHELNR